MRTYTVDIVLSQQQLESFYAGQVQNVWARDIFGVSLSFPLNALRPFVTHTGIAGRFEVRVTSDNRLGGIERVYTLPKYS